MEKINALIDKLQELKNSGAALTAISYYVQLLQAEIRYTANDHQPPNVPSDKVQSDVAIIMPVQPPVFTNPAVTHATRLPFHHLSESLALTKTKQEPPLADPIIEKQQPVTEQAITANHHSHASKKFHKDLNDLAGNNPSLNDHFQQQQPEIAQKLGGAPVNDLRSAIGINDKYQFIQELFRGDADLYERSIKTINECHNFQEADYWIQREIKIIQGWEDNHPLVRHFYTLLRKRFS